MITVEGCDGSGKSTLVKHLSDRFSLDIGQRGVTNRDRLYEVTRKDTYLHLALAISGKEAPKILDRLWISEYVYHSIAPGRPCEFSAYETEFIRNVINAIGCPFILCLPPYDTVYKNAMKAHQMKGVKGAVEEIYAAYSIGDLPWPDNVIHYDYTGQRGDFASLEEVEEEIEGYLEQRKARQAWV